jgi:hypothetical protein
MALSVTQAIHQIPRATMPQAVLLWSGLICRSRWMKEGYASFCG